MCPVELLRVSVCRPDLVIGLSLPFVSNCTHRKNSDDTLLTIRRDRRAMLGTVFAGDRDAHTRRDDPSIPAWSEDQLDSLSAPEMEAPYWSGALNA
jgi:hypothetical protein